MGPALRLSDIERFLAVGAHCDDVDLRCGGTFARLCREGKRGYCVVAVENSHVGPHCQVASSRDALAMRRDETTKAAGILGAHRVEWLTMKGAYFSTNAPGSVIYPAMESLEGLNRELCGAIFEGLPPVAHARHFRECVSRLADLILTSSPTLILTHLPDDIHPDHYSVASFVVHVVRRLRRDRGLEIPVWFWEPGSYGPMADFVPHLFVELAEEDVEAKQAAIDCYASQFTDEVRSLAHDRCRAYGRLAGVEFAEAFKECRFFEGNPWRGSSAFLEQAAARCNGTLHPLE